MIRKCTEGNKFTKSQKKINPLIYLDDINLFAKNEIALETDTNIQPGYRDGICQKICYAYNEK